MAEISATRVPGRPLVILDHDDVLHLGIMAEVDDPLLAAERLVHAELWGRLPDGRYYIKDWIGCSIHPDLSTQEQRKTAPYKRWRKAVLKRDGHRCCFCGNREGRMHAHHIEAWAITPERRLDIDNGITLCADCHMRLHNGGQNALE